MKRDWLKALVLTALLVLCASFWTWLVVTVWRMVRP
jgi:hypothetical protein